MKKNILLFLMFLISFFIHCNGQDCGIERWKVKTLSDSDTTLINFDSIKISSVHEQVNLEVTFGRLHERLKSERDVFSIDCLIIGFKKEEDKDIHIIVEDINTDETMVIEIISPECSDVKITSRYHQFKELNEWFAKNIGVPRSSFTFLSEHKLVTITGVGFWDFLHGQKGMATNGREIHPVLSMKLKPLK